MLFSDHVQRAITHTRNKHSMEVTVAIVEQEKEEDKVLNIIYPTSLVKYKGNIREIQRKKGNVSYLVRINYGEHTINKTCSKYEDASNFLKGYNIVNKLPIKNMIYEKADHLVVHLTKGQVCKVDKESIGIIQEYCWNAAYTESGHAYYAATTINDSTVKLHNMIMKHTPTKKVTIDHIDCNPLNNRRDNLRPMTRHDQNIHRHPENAAKRKGWGAEFKSANDLFIRKRPRLKK